MSPINTILPTVRIIGISDSYNVNSSLYESTTTISFLPPELNVI